MDIKQDNELDPLLRQVAREKGTEVPFTGKYVNEKSAGVYQCAICGQDLFSSETKFDSGTGWPSFTDPANLAHIELKNDTSHGMTRVEVCFVKNAELIWDMFLMTGRQKKEASVTALIRSVWSSKRRPRNADLKPPRGISY